MSSSIEQLDSFDAAERRKALEALAGEVRGAPEGGNVNMHFHSFFSYNGEGWSPSHIAFEARKAGLHAAGLCDFDVLDGMGEFLEAGRLLGLRTAVFLETRAYLAEFGDVDINSPGEPGVAYVMGAGFTALPPSAGDHAATLASFKAQAHNRNRQLVDRVNRKLLNIAIDYQADVLPLTPGGNATERHIVAAYVDAASQRYPGQALEGFWGQVFGLEAAAVRPLLADRVKLEEAARSKLAKRGGLGYVQPSAETFPPMSEFLAWVAGCGAIPMIAWLDGTSGGEADPMALFECMMGKGAAALNIIPDRNWNYKDPDQAALKQARLAECVEAARQLDLPINIGTEMNKPGMLFVDDLGGPVLSRYREDFTRGADVMVGHTLLARYAQRGYLSDAARAQWPQPADRNAAFAAVGALPPIDEARDHDLLAMGADRAADRLIDASRRGQW